MPYNHCAEYAWKVQRGDAFNINAELTKDMKLSKKTCLKLLTLKPRNVSVSTFQDTTFYKSSWTMR